MSQKKKTLRSTRDFVELLDAQGQLCVIDEEVSPELELAKIQREVCKRKGPALLFTNVKGTKFPVATNLYGSVHRMELAFGDESKKFVGQVADWAMNFMPPNLKKILAAKDIAFRGLKVGLKREKSGACRNRIRSAGLEKLPQIKSWPEDGGPFVTLPLVYTQCPKSGKGNLGMYRVQLFDKNHAGMHVQLHRGAGFHLYEAEKRKIPLKTRLFVGGPPALTIAAIAPLPEDIPELIFASMLMGEKLRIGDPDDFGLPMVLDADFSIQGKIPPFETRPEGPFGDHYGYYSLQHDYPFMKVDSVCYRDKAIFPATVVGRPPQEDHFIAEFLQEILEPLFPLVMPNVKKVWAYEESGVHSLAGAVVKNRYYKEAFTAALRILSEGHLSLTKFLFVTDQDVEIKDFKKLLVAVLERADLKKDLYILSNISQDTLDYTGPGVNQGSKAIMMGIGEVKNRLKEQLDQEPKTKGIEHWKIFCPGVLCLKGAAYSMDPELPKRLIDDPGISGFSMVIVLDELEEPCRSSEDFIWHVFTRFEPAADIYGRTQIDRFHIGIDGPAIVDCRMKPGYPGVLVDDPEIEKLFEECWASKIERICKG